MDKVHKPTSNNCEWSLCCRLPTCCLLRFFFTALHVDTSWSAIHKVTFLLHLFYTEVCNYQDKSQFWPLVSFYSESYTWNFYVQDPHHRNYSRVLKQQTQFLRLPCSCGGSDCGCCATLSVPPLDFNQRGRSYSFSWEFPQYINLRRLSA
jgi:hypothetical protein